MLPTLKRRGMLVFKGDTVQSKRRTVSEHFEVPRYSEKDRIGELIRGEGRVVCSGVTIQGMETRFKEQVDVGDLIFIHHPQSLSQEHRSVTSVLSQRSLTVEKAFSSDFVSTIEYEIRKTQGRPHDHSNGHIKKEEVTGPDTPPCSTIRKETHEQPSEQILTYREKVGMSYRTVSVKVDKDMSREDLLNIQTKKSHDRYC